MQTLFKLTLLTLLLLGGVRAMAQTLEIKSGLNLSTMYAKDQRETYSDDFELAPGFTLGVTGEFPVSESLSVESGLIFSSKGYKIDTYYPVPTFSGEFFPIDERATLNYIDIPVMLKLTTSSKKTQLFGALGPYVALGLSGKINREEYGIDDQGAIVYKGSVDYAGEMGKDGQWKRFDYGMQAGVGMIIRKIVFRINYSYGLANIAQQENLTNNNRVIGVSLGYIINK
ncbi:porin family protein [uncultured Sunxiuqinia sp.]|uniref:porin family protein n=1 Tax=uncultured Sunxiuqinia sp. TaxID=1573825 RepID=UPI00260E296A|nr:porin family protein [uncultured Sunxiuqinia sp.]